MDLSLNCLKKAKKQVNGWCVNSSAINLPMMPESFEYVVCSEMIYYLDDVSRFLSEAHEVLRPGGKLIVVTANQLVVGLGKTLGVLLKLKPYDIAKQGFYRKSVMKALRETGFKNVEGRGAGLLPWATFKFLDRTYLNKLNIGFFHVVTGYK